VNCAREVRAALHDEPDLKVRIGIHLGDVVFSNNPVLGDGVNVASRIHAVAPPVGICASANVHDEIRNKPGTRLKTSASRDTRTCRARYARIKSSRPTTSQSRPHRLGTSARPCSSRSRV